ncbi:MAG: cell division protein FtsQ/DivIB [Alphaproteobacteria bacterium]
MTAKTARSGDRQRPAPRRPLRRRAAILGAAGAGLIAVGGGLWQAGLVDLAVDRVTEALLEASGDFGLRIENVLVEGRSETGRTALLEAFGHGRGDPVFAVDTRAARARIEALPWVRSALVERRLPDTIYLRLAERRPMALWQRGETFVVVDWDGVVVEKNDVIRFRNLPVIVGDDAPVEAARLFAFMETAPNLKARVVAAVRVGQRRWNLRLDNGIDVRLPETEPALAWAQFVELERGQKLTSRDIVAIDLRQPGRLIVQMTPSGATRSRVPAKDT